MKTSVKQVIAVIALVAVIAASLPIAAFGMAETNANVQPDEIWDGSIAEGFAGGTGTEADPYLISNGAELAYLAQQTNSGAGYEGTYFALTNDIYLNDTTDWESWGDGNVPANEWTSIGPYSGSLSGFSGSFDGGGHAVSGIYGASGLFGRIGGNGEITDLGVSESYVCAGSIVDLNEGTVTNCYNTGNVNGSGYVGGVVARNGGTVTNCYNTGCVNCNSTEDVCVGGVVGMTLTSISNCYNTGSVTGVNCVGGVVGVTMTSISNCYNTGSVTGVNYVGGVVGRIYSGTFRNVYNTGSVTGVNDVGGVVGAKFGGSVINCYYLDTSCESGDGYATALTDEQMREADSFVGFDFNEVWTMEGSAEYPYPELISNPHMGSAMLGDLDGDGVITVVDANAALRIALELEDFNPIGDVDSDGAVTLADANAILRLALGL